MPNSDAGNGAGQRETVRVRITGRGIDLEREVPITWLPALMSLLFGTQEPIGLPTSMPHTGSLTSQVGRPNVTGLERPTGVVEYIREKQPQTSSDTILVLAGFLELHENRRPFSRDDLRRLMRAARLPEPANFPRDVGVAVTKGYIQPLGDGFQLTNSGLQLVGQAGPLVAGRGRSASRARRGPRLHSEEE